MALAYEIYKKNVFFGSTGEKFVHESIIGSKFSCELVREGPIIGCGGGENRFKSVIPTIGWGPIIFCHKL